MSFEDLDVWKRAARLSADLYRAFDGSREFGFKDQITRSALSVASNIAEGHEREWGKNRIQFFNYARGSCGELRTQIYIGMEVGYIQPETGKAWINETREISAMLCGLIRSLRNKHNRSKADK